MDKHPDRFKTLTDTMRNVYTDPNYKKAVLKAKAPWEYIVFGGPGGRRWKRWGSSGETAKT